MYQLLCVALLPGVAGAQGPVQKVLQQAQSPSALEENLKKLTDEVGGRVPGTPAMANAVAWGVNAFKQAGAESAHTETFTIPTSWSEGNTRVVVTSPATFDVRAVSLPWTPAFVPRGSVRFIDVGEGSEQAFKAQSVRGAVVLVHTKLLQTLDDLFGEYLEAPPILERAMQGKAAAVAFISSREHDLLYRHFDSDPGLPSKISQFLIAREDGERIGRLAANGKPVLASVSIPNRLGPAIQSQNVIAEIKGSDNSGEFVIVGAHLDSWELGTGALDNGCNAALVIDALRAIKAAGVVPRRTIKFMLYSGEEEGMLGSRDWVAKHHGELDKIVADIVVDEGTGAITGFSVGGRKDIIPELTHLAAPLKPLGVAEFTPDAIVGTDNLHLMLEGVPNLVANQDGANYMVNYHASSDTFDKVDLKNLRNHVAIVAALAFAIADDPQRLGKRQSLSEVQAMVRETKIEDQLKAFGFWADWQKIQAESNR